MLVEIEEEEEFPPFGSQSYVDGLDILDGIFQKKLKGKNAPFILWLRWAALPTVAASCGAMLQKREWLNSNGEKQ